LAAGSGLRRQKTNFARSPLLERPQTGKERHLMAVDIFIKIDSVDGEAQDSKHKKEIDVLSWSWGMSNAGSAYSGGGCWSR
jgi:hypothetical protein